MNGRVVLVSTVAAAQGSRAAAAALACAGSEPDRPALLIDVGGRPPRPTLVASSGARELEERLAVHLPQVRAASRGQTCHLAVGGDSDALEEIRAALPLVRDSVAVVHAPPTVFQEFVGEPGIAPSGILLRADLASDRALSALVVRDLLSRGLVVRVLKRPLAWVSARRALFGVLPTNAAGGLSQHVREALLESETSAEHPCYGGSDDTQADTARTSQQQRRDHAGPGRRSGLHRHAEREAGR